jgi:hypothetical protein
VIGVQIGHRLVGAGQFGGAARGVRQGLARVVAHVFGDVDPLRRAARLGRTEEVREQIVPLARSTRAHRSDAH